MRSVVSIRAAAVLAVAGLSAFALACSGGGEEKMEKVASPAAAAKSTAAAGGGAASGGSSAVAVELTEWAVKASGPAKAGKVEFTTKNAGSTPHELVVVKSDADAAALPKNASGLVDETRSPVSGKTKQLADGQSEKLEVTLTAGKYVLLCNIAGHYDLGMRTAFTVN